MRKFALKPPPKLDAHRFEMHAPFDVKPLPRPAPRLFELKRSGRAPAEKLSPAVAVEAAIMALPFIWGEPIDPGADVLDLPHWVCLVFQLRAQRDEFLVALGLEEGAKHVDGDDVAKSLGLKLPAARSRVGAKPWGGFAVRAPTEPAPAELEPPPEAPAEELEAEPERSSFQERAQAEQKRFEAATDSEYWVCVCLRSEEQRAAMAKSLGVAPEERFLDGLAVAKRFDIAIATPSPQWREAKIRRI